MIRQARIQAALDLIAEYPDIHNDSHIFNECLSLDISAQGYAIAIGEIMPTSKKTPA
jgi:hypothetical protein